MTRLAGRVVLVTGGGSGIGRAIASACAAEGARVALVGRRPGPLEETAAALEAAHGAGCAVPLPGDVARRGDPARLVAAAVAACGRLDGLVNDAAVFRLHPLAETDDDELELIFRTNVVGLLALCREALPHLAAARSGGTRGGAILNLSSVVGQAVLPDSVPYAASKAAVEHLTRGLAVELGPRGVRVNALAPGTTETELAAELTEDPARRAATVAATPLGRLGRPDDMGPPAVFLLSDEARWITGQVLQAAGGLLL